MKRRRYRLRVRKRRRPRRLRLFGSGISRPYIKRNRLMLGSGSKVSKQRGGFFPLLNAAIPALDLLSKIIK